MIKKIIMISSFLAFSFLMSAACASECQSTFQGLSFSYAAILKSVSGGLAMNCYYQGHKYIAAPNAKPILPGKWEALGLGSYLCKSNNINECQYIAA